MVNPLPLIEWNPTRLSSRAVLRRAFQKQFISMYAVLPKSSYRSQKFAALPA